MEFIRARSIDEALAAGREQGAAFIAGGTNLVPDLLFGRKSCARVVDISRLRELRFIEERHGRLRIGPLATVTDLLEFPLVRKLAPPLRECAEEFAGPLVRNRATVGGNLLDASPAADLAPPLMALDGRAEVRSLEGSREIPLREFFLSYRKTALGPGEMLTGLSIRPLGENDRSAYHKLQLRRAMAISVVSVAVALRMEGGVCAEAGIGMGAVAEVPYRSERAEAALRGKTVSEADVEAAARAAEAEASPISDVRASAAYRRRMCHVLVRRLLRQALGMGS